MCCFCCTIMEYDLLKTIPFFLVLFNPIFVDDEAKVDFKRLILVGTLI